MHGTVHRQDPSLYPRTAKGSTATVPYIYGSVHSTVHSTVQDQDHSPYPYSCHSSHAQDYLDDSRHGFGNGSRYKDHRGPFATLHNEDFRELHGCHYLTSVLSGTGPGPLLDMMITF